MVAATYDRPMAHTLVLLRHGESTWNQENLFTGWHDVPLTDKGDGRPPSRAGPWPRRACGSTRPTPRC